MHVTAYIGLGSNLGDRASQLRLALQGLERHDVVVTRVSSVYESAPVGPILDQPSFFNAVAEVRVGLAPVELLRSCMAVERDLGRERIEPQGPRTIDLDLLLYADIVEAQPELILPHPRLAERAFVLLPLLELAPALVDPRDGMPLSQQLDAVRGQAIACIGEQLVTSRCGTNHDAATARRGQHVAAALTTVSSLTSATPLEP